PQSEQDLRFTMLDHPAHCRTKVIQLPFQPVQPRRLLAVSLLDHRQEELRVSLPDGLPFPALLQVLPPILPDRLESPVPHLRAPSIGDDECLLQELREQIPDRVRFDALARARGPGCSPGKTAGKYRDPAQERLLLRREQVIAPVYQGPQR